jgi:homoserine dehydrogenase
MSHYRLAFLGFGNVGQALAKLLLCKQDEIKTRYGITFSVAGIATGRHGAAIDPDGIDLPAALSIMSQGGPLTALSKLEPPASGLDFVKRCSADVLFENTPVNYESGEPAVSHLRAALGLGMHAITANKGAVVHAYRELSDLAAARGVKFFFESAVMDGTPIFSLFREALPAAQLRSLRGVLNSTTNLILTRMEAGESFEEAVAYAQSIGIAETNPSSDIDGWDAAVKVSALATVLMGAPLKPTQVERKGIRGIDRQAIELARSQGKRWKLVCSAERGEEGVRGRVAPEMVDCSSPMYAIENTTSIIQLESDVLGLLTVIEADPGTHTTAYGLLADFLNAVRSSAG